MYCIYSLLQKWQLVTLLGVFSYWMYFICCFPNVCAAQNENDSHVSILYISNCNKTVQLLIGHVDVSWESIIRSCFPLVDNYLNEFITFSLFLNRHLITMVTLVIRHHCWFLCSVVFNIVMILRVSGWKETFIISQFYHIRAFFNIFIIIIIFIIVIVFSLLLLNFYFFTFIFYWYNCYYCYICFHSYYRWW